MNDTPQSMQKKYHDLLMQKTNIERFLMGFSMFDAAKEMVLASCRNNYSSLEKKLHLLARFYGNDFSEEQMNDIISYLKKIDKI